MTSPTIKKKRPTKTAQDFLRMLRKTEDLWDDSDSNRSSNNENDECIISSTKKFHSETPHESSNVSVEEIIQPVTPHCCLICSILHSLSNDNCCPQHLATLINDQSVSTTSTVKSLSKPVVYMMAPGQWPMPKCPCQSRCSKSKRCRCSSTSSSSSSSSSSSTSSSSNSRRPARKRRRQGLLSSSTTNEKEVLSITEPEISIIDHPSDIVHTPMSPSLPPSRTLSNKFARTPITISIEDENPRAIQRSVHFLTPRDEAEQRTDSNITYTPRLLLDRVVHVKDEGEQLPGDENHSQITILNMSQATKQMINQTNASQPKIYLKRIILDD